MCMQFEHVYWKYSHEFLISELTCLLLRTWLKKLKVPVCSKRRRQLRLNSARLKVTTKKQRADGTYSVPLS